MIVLEVFALALLKYRRRKRAKPLALLDARIQDIFHSGQTGMSQYGAVAERARPPFHASLKPAYNVARRDLLGNRVEQRFALQFNVAQTEFFQIGFDASVRKLRTEIGVLHYKTARLIENSVVSVESRANSQSFIAGSRLDPGTAKRGSREQLSIGNAVEGASACQGQILQRYTLVKLVEQMEEHIFEAALHGVGKVHLALSDLGVRWTWMAKSLDHTIGKVVRQSNRTVRQNLHSLIAAQRFEETVVKIEAAVFWTNNFGQLFAQCVPSIRREAHNLAFIAVLRVADELANHRIETAERVRQENSIEHFDLIAFAARHHGGNEVSGTVVAEPCGLIPR